MPPPPTSLATHVAEELVQVPAKTAGIFGSAVRGGLKGAHVTRDEAWSEIHRLEAGAGALAAFSLVVFGLVAWGAFAWYVGPPKRRT